MKVCIVGDGLVSLSLAKAIINQGIKVDLILDKNSKKLINLEQSEFLSIILIFLIITF